MSGSEAREGGCACGAVRYRVTGAPIMVHQCHCRQCQQQTGSTGVVNAFWESEKVEMAGDLEDSTLPRGGGEPHVLRRCAACGSPIVSHYGRLGRLLSGLRVGSLDDPASVTPNVILFVAEKMPWVTLPESIPAFPGYYDPREVLSVNSLDRLRALSARRRAGEG